MKLMCHLVKHHDTKQYWCDHDLQAPKKAIKGMPNQSNFKWHPIVSAIEHECRFYSIALKESKYEWNWLGLYGCIVNESKTKTSKVKRDLSAFLLTVYHLSKRFQASSNLSLVSSSYLPLSCVREA